MGRPPGGRRGRQTRVCGAGSVGRYALRRRRPNVCKHACPQRDGYATLVFDSLHRQRARGQRCPAWTRADPPWSPDVPRPARSCTPAACSSAPSPGAPTAAAALRPTLQPKTLAAHPTADRAPHDVLRYLGRRVDDLPLMVVVTYRGRSALQRVLGALGGRAVRRLARARLSRSAVARLAGGTTLTSARRLRDGGRRGLR
jgi:hypothetical protein